MSGSSKILEMRSDDGLVLHARIDAVSGSKKPLVLLAHGLGEHCARYDYVVSRLNSAGYGVARMDHRGHGHSGGKRGRVRRFTQFSSDWNKLVEAVRQVHQGDLVQLGHSFGGLFTAKFALDHPTLFRSLVITGPALGVAMEVPMVKAAAGRILSSILPDLALANGIPVEAICTDLDVVRAYEADPLVHDRISTRMYTELMGAMDEVNRRAGELKLPVLVMHGGRDEITPPAASRAFVQRLGSAKKEYVELPGQYHEILNEPQRDSTIGKIVEWFDRTAAA